MNNSNTSAPSPTVPETTPSTTKLWKVELPNQRKFVSGSLIEHTGDRVLLMVDGEGTLNCPISWVTEPSGFYCRKDVPQSPYATPSAKDRRKSGLGDRY